MKFGEQTGVPERTRLQRRVLSGFYDQINRAITLIERWPPLNE